MPAVMAHVNSEVYVCGVYVETGFGAPARHGLRVMDFRGRTPAAVVAALGPALSPAGRRGP